ncbi:VirB4 family type IV secretion/conjugal transfer ATPase [Hydrogenophaga taeniospiralis]|uniref:VirB4 family type IV secretion/conjugal transfer ATPase n=1 Tax=Hydrogenophaga taeniospiralis TaxID=65656 RepID=UPI001CF97A08|nr:VirB4 family type IV secretion/conjugal transfer ATPase [Hydrogenophaga taeniospiralis]MCB4365462.1 VirB4 family type IV secretion/conjugal transfer ATPase [Hydrogenophaga taeniospiralis]
MSGIFDRLGKASGRKRHRPAPGQPQPRHWSQALVENPLSRFVPLSSLLSDHDVITRGGDFLRVWRLDGVAFECADDHLINERHEALCSLLRNLSGGQWAIWTHRLHRKIQDALSDPVGEGFAKDLSQAYQAHLNQRAMMSNELYLTLVYRPNISRVSRALQSPHRSKAAIAESHADALRVMEERTAFVHRVLRGFGPQLLGVREQRGRRYSEVAEFLGYLVNGYWKQVPQAAGPLYRTLPSTRLSFGGDKLELRYGDQRRCAALVDIKEYADAVEPGILNALLYEHSEFIETQSFSILPRREATRALELQRDQLIASDDVVASQIANMDEALNELGDGQFCMGEYHYSLVVFGNPGEDSLADAGRRAAQAIGAVGESSSLQMSPVDLVADAAWFAQMPGNWQWRPRDAKLSSRAFAALASGHNFARGKRDGNPWGEALALLRTPSGQPFYLNFHSSPDGEDSADKKLPGNTIIIGSTGVGKTTLEMFLLTLTRKWSPAPRLVLFDLDRGCEIAIRAMNGRYFTLEAGKPTHLNPLQRDPTPARIQFWEQLVRTCIATPALPLLPSDERAIANAVNTVAMMPTALRRFSTIRQNLPKSGDNSLYERLGRWCEGGALGWVFDQANDQLLNLDSASVIAFDTTEFLDLPEVRTPVMLYLLQVMEELVNGERLIYVISEFWKALDHEIFSDFAKQKQKTIRKQNGLGIFDTQSPSDVLRHPIGRTMVEQSVTKIFLANPEAVREEYVEGFGLSEAEFGIVRSLGAQGGRRFLVKQGHSSAICELDLSGLQDYVTVLSATTDNVVLLDTVREQHGNDPLLWLPVLLREVQDRKSRNSRRAT